MTKNKRKKANFMRHALCLLIIFCMLSVTGCGIGEIIIYPDNETAGEKTPADTETSQENTVTGDLEVHFIDVGQADCILVKNDENAMLIDAGNNGDANLIKSYLNNQNITKLDYVVGTHPHEDHIGSLDMVINTFDIGTIIMPNKISTTKTFEDVVTAIENKNLSITEAKVGDNYKLGDAEFTILAPGKDYGDDNNASVVLRLVYGKNSFMLTGDAESISEKDILETGLTLKSDVLKFGHHGSSSSTSYAFLNAVSPKYGVIMCGTDNSYGHPHMETLNKIYKYKIEAYRTDEQGHIIAISDGNSISWITTKEDLNSSPNNEMEYVLNTKSKKFHYPSCSGASKIAEENKKEVFLSRIQLITEGYTACGTCKP